MSGVSRRDFLRGVSAVAIAVPLAAAVPGVARAAPGFEGIDVRPRSAWAQGLPAPHGLPREQPGDVRFVVVHHSATPNGYAPGDVPGVLRGFHSVHTGPDMGWPDVAYNFFVDRYGVVWEGRAGSLAGPVIPDATGGSQGFSQVVCFVGDHTTQPPTDEARRSMTLLLAALAARYDLDPRGMTNFVSRGSNKWAAGTPVTAHTIVGHRDMSQTACPGDAAYLLVRDRFPGDVAAVLAARASRPTPSPEPSPEPSPSPSGTPSAEPSLSAGSASSGGAAPSTTARGTTPAAAGPATDDDGVDATTVALIATGVAAAGTTAGVVHRLRQRATPHGAHRASRRPPPAAGSKGQEPPG